MKKLFKLIGALLALILVIALAAPMFISADYLKAQLSAQVKKATGRELVIKGDASVQLLPNIAVKVEDVTLGNPAGFTGEYFVHINTLETGAALKPLLNKELRITGLTLVGATINLEELATGAKNWEFASPAPADATAKPAAASNASASESPLKQFAIGTVSIKDSTIRYSKPGEKPLALEGISLSLDGADGASPLKLKGEATLRGEKIALALDVKSLKEFTAGKLSPTTLALTLPSAKVGFVGSAGAKGAEFGAEGKLDATIADMAKLQSWATGKTAKPAFPRSVTLASQLKASGVKKTIALEGLNATLDTTKATGALRIGYGETVPNIAGELSLASLDLDALAGGNAGASGAGNVAAASAAKPAPSTDGWSDAPIDASGLRAANANVKLSIGSLKSGAVQVADIAATVVLSGGKLALNLGNATLYGGKAQGTVNLDGSGKGVGLASNMTLSGIQIEPLMVALSGASKLKGTANLTLDVKGSGASQRAIVGALDGRGSMNVRDGAIKGINIASFLRSAKQGFILSEKTTESTDFTELTASFTITNGMVSNEDLSMKSPVLRVAGKGTVNLPARTVDYRLVPNIVTNLQGQGATDNARGLEVPLIIRGPWSKISVTPDMAGMIDNAIKNPEALKQNLKDIKGSLKDFNSPKDIGKALLGGGKKEDEEPAPATTAPAATPGTEPAPAAPAPQPDAKQQLIQQGIGGLLNQLEKKQ